jgi:hypothetical protein
LSNPITAILGFGPWLTRRRANGLNDVTWVPTLCVDGRIVGPLLAELRRAGVPAACTRLRRGWRPPPHHSEWCVWVGYDKYWQAEERLAEVVPLLISSLRRGTAAA